jgi:4-amino-4-deoxy-L-arabinose transferase-like glycosyltransferase
MKIVKYLLFFLLLFIFVNFIFLSFDVLFYKFDIDFSESFMFYALKNLDKGIPIYHNPYEYPYNIVKYPPIYYLISYPFYKMFGLNLFSLRIVSAIFFLLTLVVLFKFLLNIKRDIVSSLAFSLFPVATTIVFWQTFQARLEWVAMFFSIFSIFLSYKYMAKKNDTIFYLALISATLALLVKQTFFVSLLSIIVFNRNKLFQILKFGAIVITILIAFNYYTNNNFLLHLTEFSKGFLEPRIQLINSIYLQYTLLFSFSFLPIFIIKNKNYNLIKMCFVISLIFNLIILLRSGSWIYYILEPIFYSSILLYILFIRAEKVLKIGLITALIISIVIWNFYDSRISMYMFNRNNYEPLVNYKADLKIESYVKKNNGNCYVEHASYLLPYNKILPESWAIIELFKNGIISEDSFRFINNYNCLIFYDRIWLFPKINEVLSSYELKERIPWKDLSFSERNFFVYEIKQH